MSREPAPGAPAECSTTHSRDCTEERAPKLGQTALALAAGNGEGAGQSLIPKVSLIAARLCSCRAGNKLPVPRRQRAAREHGHSKTQRKVRQQRQRWRKRERPPTRFIELSTRSPLSKRSCSVPRSAGRKRTQLMAALSSSCLRQETSCGWAGNACSISTTTLSVLSGLHRCGQSF